MVAMPIPFMEDFSIASWFVGLQIPTRSKVAAEQPSSLNGRKTKWPPIRIL